MRSLIICEKNDAAKQIAKALSDGNAKQKKGAVPIYPIEWRDGPAIVMGLRGHILETDFEAGHERWSIKEDKLHALIDAPVRKTITEEKIVEALRREAKVAQRIVVATDYDREGELIGVEALETIKDLIGGKEVHRAKYSSFTKKEVQQAFDNLQEVDYKLAQAGEARQVIDLAWGAALTRYLSITGGRRGGDFLSVGRVQSPTLGLIVDREKEILAFVSEPYWEIEADMQTKPAFTATHEAQPFWKDEPAKSAFGRIKAAGKATVTKVEKKEVTRKAPVPFHTTGYIQAAGGLGLGAKRAMDVAQKLYLNGFISYHRTENTVYPPTLDLNEIVSELARGGAVAEDAKWVAKNRRPEPTRGKKETKDHPPIYPTAVPGAGDKLSDQEVRVWELVARRFLATLSPDARVATVAVALNAGGEGLKANGQTTLEAGWRRVYPYSKGQETPLPSLAEGDTLTIADTRLLGKETQPPKRYGQGTLIAKMEELGIGTKATRHETIQKLIDRAYITEDPVQPTTIAFAVTDTLEQHAKQITEAEMTARLEEEMTQIEQGARGLEATLDDSRALLHEVVDTLLRNHEPIKDAVRKALEEDALVGTCPTCGDKLLKRSGRFGMFVGCKAYPDCRTTFNVPRGRVDFQPEPCPECSAPQIILKTRSGTVAQCLNGECPTRQKAAEEEKFELGTCPKCNEGTLVAQRSRNWKRYVKCDNESCDQTYPLPQRGAIKYEDVRCETCAAPRVLVLTKGRKPWDICVNMECPSKEKAEGEDDAGGARPVKKAKAAKATKAAKKSTKAAKATKAAKKSATKET
jgi:DNA topoisomerase I